MDAVAVRTLAGVATSNPGGSIVEHRHTHGAGRVVLDTDEVVGALAGVALAGADGAVAVLDAEAADAQLAAGAWGAIGNAIEAAAAPALEAQAHLLAATRHGGAAALRALRCCAGRRASAGTAQAFAGVVAGVPGRSVVEGRDADATNASQDAALAVLCACGGERADVDANIALAGAALALTVV